MGTVLLDSSAVVGFLQRDDALHSPASTEVGRVVRAGSPLAISAVTWMEILTGAALGHREQTIVRGFVADFAIAILPVDAGIAERAARIRARSARSPAGAASRPTISPPDALILATADVEPDIDRVVGGDARWTRVCRSLRVSFVPLRA